MRRGDCGPVICYSSFQEVPLLLRLLQLSFLKGFMKMLKFQKCPLRQSVARPWIGTVYSAIYFLLFLISLLKVTFNWSFGRTGSLGLSDDCRSAHGLVLSESLGRKFVNLASSELCLLARTPLEKRTPI